MTNGRGIRQQFGGDPGAMRVIQAPIRRGTGGIEGVLAVVSWASGGLRALSHPAQSRASGIYIFYDYCGVIKEAPAAAD